MEEGKARPSDGVLAHLELLEARAHEAAVKEEEEEEREEKLARLKARVQELRLQRDELRAKLELQQKGQLGEGGAVSDGAQPSARAVLEWKIRSLQAMLGVFYLTGLSGKLTERGVCFCISTAYGGTYLDSYHLDLLLHLDVQIGRHSVPACIPLQQLAQKYLQTDVRRFLAVLAAHLNAYAGRRYQADQLQERFSDQLAGSLQRNSLCNLLVFHYHVARESKTFPLRARLLYGDLCCSLPTEVSVSCPRKRPTRGSGGGAPARSQQDQDRPDSAQPVLVRSGTAWRAAGGRNSDPTSPIVPVRVCSGQLSGLGLVENLAPSPVIFEGGAPAGLRGPTCSSREGLGPIVSSLDPQPWRRARSCELLGSRRGWRRSRVLAQTFPPAVAPRLGADAPASLAAAAAAHSELFRRVGLPEAFLSLRHAEASVVGAP
ncbi:centromere protein O [Leptosomus discolor]